MVSLGFDNKNSEKNSKIGSDMLVFVYFLTLKLDNIFWLLRSGLPPYFLAGRVLLNVAHQSVCRGRLSTSLSFPDGDDDV